MARINIIVNKEGAELTPEQITSYTTNKNTILFNENNKSIYVDGEEYGNLSHSHTEFATVEQLGHSHSTYAKTNHSHSIYLISLEHEHTEYITSLEHEHDLSHSHSQYITSLSHNHTEFATTSHSHNLSHSHSAYLTSLKHKHTEYITSLAHEHDLSHSHSQYITSLSHNHTEFATTSHSHNLSHSHSTYLTSLKHEHTEYITSLAHEHDLSHSHSQYLTSLNHNHTEFATTSHSHNLSHSHSQYITSLSHNHTEFATTSHSHNLSHSHSQYITSLSHNHTEFATTSHSHNLSHSHSIYLTSLEHEHTEYITSLAHEHDLSHSHSQYITSLNHNHTEFATVSYVQTSIADLVDSAPETLDTLNELAAALGDDPNFATTVAGQIGTKYTKPGTGIPVSDLESGALDHSHSGYITSLSHNHTEFATTSHSHQHVHPSYESVSNKTTVWLTEHSDEAYPTEKLVKTSLDLKANATHSHNNYSNISHNHTAYELSANKVTSLSSSSTNTQYPSAKAVYDNMVSALGISGNYLTVTKAGSTSNITVPYATNADTLDSYHETAFFRNRGAISVNYVDLSTYTANAENFQNPDNGIWSVSRSGHSAALLTFTGGGSASGLDIYFDYSKGSDFKFRRRIDSNRISGDWEIILTNQNYTSYTVTKSGTGASGTWGISISGTAAKATADASGNTITSTYATKTEVNAKQNTSNLVTSISSSSTDTQYPSAKCVYDAIPDDYEIDYSKHYLTFEAVTAGILKFIIPSTITTSYVTSVSYSLNGGAWVTTSNTSSKIEISVSMNVGDKVSWKGIGTKYGYEDNSSGCFTSTNNVNVYGNIMSLLYGDDFIGNDIITESGVFANLFSDYDSKVDVCSIIDASNLILPAITLVDYCYFNMFYSCTLLTTTPALHATTLAKYCYSGMFYGCTSLKTAPALPATTLAKYCYSSMFNGCTSLTTVPILPATTLISGCYYYMFQGCTSLNYIKALFTTTPSSAYTNNWVYRVANTGTFVKSDDATWDVTGVNGIPTGWTVKYDEIKKSTIDGKEDKSNKVTLISSSSTDTQYPSAKCVYDELNSIDYSDINPIQTKTYTGVLGTANTLAGATFYFAKIVPTSYYAIWKIKYKIRTYVPDKNGYDMVAEVMMSGDQSSLRSYASMNTVSTSYPAYYHELYRATSAGVTSGYGHALGVRLYSAYNPTTVGYERTIDIEVYETENCTLTFFDECLLYANIPGTGSTNYSDRSEINYCSNGLQESGDVNDPNYQNRIYYTSSRAATNIYRNQFVLRTPDKELIPVSSANNDFTIGKTYTTTPFDPFGEVYYYNSTTSISSGGNIGNAVLYRQYIADLRYAFDLNNSATYKLTAREPVYLTATLQPDGTAVLTVPSGSTIGPLAQSLPTSDDGLIYIYLGQAYEDTYPYRVELILDHPVYWYKNGRVREVTPETINLKGNELSREFTYDTTGGSTTVDSGYAWAKKIKGNTIVWNQLNKYVYAADSEKSLNGITMHQNADGTFYFNGTATADTTFYCLGTQLAEYYPIPSGHIGLYNLVHISGTIVDSTNGSKLSYGRVQFGVTSYKGIHTDTSDFRYFLAIFKSGCVCTNATFKFNLFDLTKMFGSGNEPSTVAEFEQLFPLDYYTYNEGQLLSFNGTSIKTVGFNIFNESELELGKYITPTTGNITTSFETRRASETYYSYIPGTQLFISRFVDGVYTQSNYGIVLCFYDANKNFIESYTTSTIVSNSTAFYFRIATNSSYGNLCVNISDTSRNGTYEPYEEHTKDISFYKSIMYNGSPLFPNGLLSAGDVYDEVTPTKAIKRVGVVDLGTLTWSYKTDVTGYNPYFVSYNSAFSGIKYIIAIYTPCSSLADFKISDKGIILSWITGGSGINITNSSYTTAAAFKTAMSGVMLYYELATPIEVTLNKMEDTYYMVDSLGTEELLPTNTSTPTTTPIKMDVVYGSNAEQTLENLVGLMDVVYDAIPTDYQTDYSKQYLTTEALGSGTISFNILSTMNTDKITSISYSTDNGNTWTTTNNTDNKSEHLVITVNVNSGDKVMWKGIAQQTGYYDETEGYSIGSYFSSTCQFNAYGNVMSMLYGDNFRNQITLTLTGQLSSLFSPNYGSGNICNIVSAENLVLPATTLAIRCYEAMFATSTLTTAPELPAITLANNCYNVMFKDCTSLTTAPELPATTLAENCYNGMFSGCTSLTTAPELPATTLVSNCYCDMFDRCTALTSAPELPATILATYCYSYMFYGCRSLTTAPELPATTLAESCYNGMFFYCTSLNYIKALFTTTPSSSYTQNWVYNVASTGTFVKSDDTTWDVTGVNGVPSGWTVKYDEISKNVLDSKVSSSTITTIVKLTQAEYDLITTPDANTLYIITAL